MTKKSFAGVSCIDRPGCGCATCVLWDQVAEAGLGEDDRIVVSVRPKTFLFERYELGGDGSCRTIASCVVERALWDLWGTQQRRDTLLKRLELV